MRVRTDENVCVLMADVFVGVHGRLHVIQRDSTDSLLSHIGRTMLRPLRFIPMLVFASAQAHEPISPNAARFVAEGGAFALRACDMPKRSCFGQALVLEAKERGSSNDEERSVETLSAPGMKADVIFPLARPAVHHVANLQVTSSRWRSLFGIAPGTPRDSVHAHLGKPNVTARESCEQYLNEEIESSATLCYRQGKVSDIRWEYFID